MFICPIHYFYNIFVSQSTISQSTVSQSTISQSTVSFRFVSQSTVSLSNKQEAWSEVTLGRILQKKKKQTWKNTSIAKHFIRLTFSYSRVIASSTQQQQQQQHTNASEFATRVFCSTLPLSWQTGWEIPGLTGAVTISVTTRVGIIQESLFVVWGTF